MSVSQRVDLSGDGYGAGLVEIDTTKARVARIYDAMLGGTSHFEVDRKAAEAAAEPVGGMAALRYSTRSNRAFLGRAVRWLVEEAGIRQFLDIGSGLPTEQNVHQIAQAAAEDARVVYVDFDPVVLAHAHELGSLQAGATKLVVADLREPKTVLEEAADTLDLGQPTGLLLFTILHNILDDEDPWGLVAGYLDVLPSGSYLAMSNLTGDFAPAEMSQSKAALDEAMVEPFITRSRDDILRFFDGTELVDPGLVSINDWHLELPPAPPERPEGSIEVPIYGAVGRKI